MTKQRCRNRDRYSSIDHAERQLGSGLAGDHCMRSPTPRDPVLKLILAATDALQLLTKEQLHGF